MRFVTEQDVTRCSNNAYARYPVALAKDSWGGRDRTFAWWDQNPLPYRLATPQKKIKPETDSLYQALPILTDINVQIKSRGPLSSLCLQITTDSNKA